MGKIVVGILAHVDAGKTTLSEGMLYTSGAIRTMGRVDNRDAFLDTYALERERGITIFSKQAVFPLGTTQVTLLDTPGHVDFSPEMERTLQVLDYAILVISGADGVQGHTRTLWNLLRRYEIPTFVFVNKMDQEGTDAEVLLQELKNVLEEGCVDFSTKRDAHFYEETAVCSEDALEEFLETGRLKKETLQELFLGKNDIVMSEEIGGAMQDLRKFMFQKVYTNPAAKGEEAKAERLLCELYAHYMGHIEILPEQYQRMHSEGEKKERVVCDYISGMTDQYAVAKYREFFLPKAWEIG